MQVRASFRLLLLTNLTKEAGCCFWPAQLRGTTQINNWVPCQQRTSYQGNLYCTHLTTPHSSVSTTQDKAATSSCLGTQIPLIFYFILKFSHYVCHMHVTCSSPLLQMWRRLGLSTVATCEWWRDQVHHRPTQHQTGNGNGEMGMKPWQSPLSVARC